MSTRPPHSPPRRPRPLIALAGGLLLALATSGTPGFAVPAAGLGDLEELRGPRPCSGARVTADAAETTSTAAASVERVALDAAPARFEPIALHAADEAEAPAAPVMDAAWRALPDAAPSTGLDLEVRIGRIHIEFPWLKSLPISPGRHVVLELMPARGDNAR